jgi:hypothetical protein
MREGTYYGTERHSRADARLYILPARGIQRSSSCHLDRDHVFCVKEEMME